MLNNLSQFKLGTLGGGSLISWTTHSDKTATDTYIHYNKDLFSNMYEKVELLFS